MSLQAPFPYFGGKASVATLVWKALGQPKHYIEPFFGSGAVLLGRPDYKQSDHIETICDKDGHVCLAPRTRILTADLRWRPIGNLAVGDKVLAFDEFNTGPRFVSGAPSGYRHWKIATVLVARRLRRPSYRLTFSDGTEIICSQDHQWLGGKNRGLRWLRTANWKSTIPRTTQKAWVLKLLNVVEQKKDYESGWLGGFADGEGHYHGSAHGGGGSWAISLHQSEGAIANYAERLLVKHGYSVRTEIRKRKSMRCQTMVSHHINGGMAETFRFLMSCRPERLIHNLLIGIEKKSIYTRKKQYVSVEKMDFIGEQEVVALETDTHTYVAEGLASHNCNVWRALQADPDAVAKVCDGPVNHIDLSARKRRLVASRETLAERLVGDEKCFDVELAGYWIWAASCWIGSGLTRPNARPHVGDGGMGVHKLSQIPHVGDGGKGVQDAYNVNLWTWFRALSERLRYVRVVCGDWSRVCNGNWQDKIGPCGMFFDPPYSHDIGRDTGLYDIETDCAQAVGDWCIEHGDRPSYRIVLAGYEGEHERLAGHGWRVVEWKAHGGYSGISGQANENRKRERLWLSPYCERQNEKQETMF